MSGKNRNAEAVERLFRLVVKLQDAGRDGLSAERLVRVAGFDAESSADAGSQLAREFRHLRKAGWQIDNVAAVGEPGHYVLRNMDVRMRVRLSADQQAALRRAALLANREDLADRLGLPAEKTPGLPLAGSVRSEVDPQLQSVLTALAQHRLLNFRYKHTAREAHPALVEVEYGKWYLHARESDGQLVKRFKISRMSELTAGEPGSAEVIPAVGHSSLQPMHWQVDEAVRVHLRAPAQFVPDVHRWLAEPQEQSDPDDRGRVVLAYDVTNRAALRARLYELGERVEVLGPPEVRDEIIDELQRMGGEA